MCTPVPWYIIPSVHEAQHNNILYIIFYINILHTCVATCMHTINREHVCIYETFGLSMEIFKYECNEYNLSRKNIKNNKPIYTLIV